MTGRKDDFPACNRHSHPRLGALALALAVLGSCGCDTAFAAPDAYPLAERDDPAARPQLYWSDEKPARASRPRQTSFDDSNYRPRSDVNLVAPPDDLYWYEGRAPGYAAAEPVVRQGAWEWLGADRKRQHGRFEWEEREGAIQYASVCRNYRRGSLLYRDCRKGAKRAFAQMCNRHKPACHAANNFMP